MRERLIGSEWYEVHCMIVCRDRVRYLWAVGGEGEKGDGPYTNS